MPRRLATREQLLSLKRLGREMGVTPSRNPHGLTCAQASRLIGDLRREAAVRAPEPRAEATHAALDDLWEQQQ